MIRVGNGVVTGGADLCGYDRVAFPYSEGSLLLPDRFYIGTRTKTKEHGSNPVKRLACGNP